MKQYTTPEQTAKLIELGFERPFRNEYLHIVEEYGYAVNKERNFTIGELIEMLPIELEDVGINTTLAIHFDNNIANVEYIGVLGIEYSIMKEELIDALYEMIVKLKEKKVL
jgi:hypothetical protein